MWHTNYICGRFSFSRKILSPQLSVSIGKDNGYQQGQGKLRLFLELRFFWEVPLGLWTTIIKTTHIQEQVDGGWDVGALISIVIFCLSSMYRND